MTTETTQDMLSKEVLEVKLGEIVEKFNRNAEVIKEKTNLIDEVNKQIAALVDEQRRFQGEYRAMYNLGTELGLIKDGEFAAPVK